MQTLVELPGAFAQLAENPQVAAYFDALQRAQAAYLQAAAAAGSALPDAAAHLRETAALQGRLTRRWFDAQRAILEQRAAVDRRAAACVDGMTFLPPSGIDGGRFERQLDALLDEWWQAERRSCATGVVLDAPFAAPMPGTIPAPIPWPSEPLEVVPAAPGSSADDALPRHLVDVLELADPDALSRLLDELVAELDTHLAVAAAAMAPAPQVLPGDLVLIGRPDEHDERFHTFWTDPSVPAEPSLMEIPASDASTDSVVNGIASRVVLPMVAVTAGLALALALIG